MGQTTLSIRMDEDIKRRFDIFCADAGMNPTVAVNLFARAVLREKRIPFEITGNSDPFYSAKN
jgi:DNA-damage-inducible protein J